MDFFEDRVDSMFFDNAMGMLLAPFLLFSISRAAHSTRSLLAKLLKSGNWDVTPDEGMTLAILRNMKNVSISELAEFVGRDRTTVSRMIDNLETKGFVQRTQGSQDKRSREVVVTDKGHELDEWIRRESKQVFTQLMQGIKPADVVKTHKTLKKLHTKAVQLAEIDT